MADCSQDYRAVFRTWHSSRPTHPSESDTYGGFSDVWSTFINDSVNGMFCDYVTRHGYPLSEKLAKDSTYIRRFAIEDKIISGIRNKNNIILIGCEGSGKTTLTHYSAGYRFFHENDIDNYSFYPINTIAYPNGSPDTIGSSFISDIFTALYSDLTRRNALDEFEVSIKDRSTRSIADALLFDLASPLAYCTTYFAYLATTMKDYVHYIIIDNVDSLSADACSNVFSYIRQFVDAIKRQIARIQLSNKTAHNCTMDPPIRFIVSVRTPTYSHVKSASLGLFPMHSISEISVENDLKENVNVWELVRGYVFSEKRSHTEATLKGLSVSIPVHQGVTRSITPEDTYDYIYGLISWLSEKTPYSDILIKRFCGRSIRRYKMYALKIIGHISLWRLYEMEKSGRISRTNKHLLERTLTEAMYDFSQPIGSVSGGDLDLFHLNPYRVIADSQARRQNPLLGIQMILWLKENEGMREKECFARKIGVGDLCEYLSGIGYTKRAICEAFSHFWVSGVLRPIKGAEVLISNGGDGPPVYAAYVIDETAFDRYYALVSAADDCIEDAVSLMNCATRRNYGAYYAPDFIDVIYACFVNLIFLADIVEAERLLTQRLATNRERREVRSYVYMVGKPLLRHWKRVLTSRMEMRIITQMQDLSTCCQELMARVSEEISCVRHEFIEV